MKTIKTKYDDKTDDDDGLITMVYETETKEWMSIAYSVVINTRLELQTLSTQRKTYTAV